MEYVTVQGEEVPALGYGTARMDESEAREAMARAIDVGYRHIDTAQVYGTEPAVGQAIADSAVDREEFFVTTKISTENVRYDDVHESFESSLERLRTDYVDLLLIHAPVEDVPVEETLSAMNELQEEGSVRHVGVSNFSVAQMEEAREASETPIFTNQVEYHPRHGQNDVLTYCIENGVMLTAYSPLDVGEVALDETLRDVAESHGKTASQVALRWLLQQEMVSAIPKAASEEHQRENFDVFDFELSDEDMRAIFSIDVGLEPGVAELLGL